MKEHKTTFIIIELFLAISKVIPAENVHLHMFVNISLLSGKFASKKIVVIFNTLFFPFPGFDSGIGP